MSPNFQCLSKLDKYIRNNTEFNEFGPIELYQLQNKLLQKL